MRRISAAVWREWESGGSAAVRVLRVAVLFLGLLFLCFTATLALSWPQQAALALLTLAAAVWMDRSFSSYVVTLTLMLVSAYSTFRYGFWRLTTTVTFARESVSPHRHIELAVMTVLLLSECYAFMALLLGYIQMAWPLRRTPVPLPDDTHDWPAVDVLIATLNEPLDVVRFTALAAANMDWPADRLNIYILDDGRRDEFRRFSEEAGLGYMTRPNNEHAKAGNLNAALERVDSPFVVILDADHVPTRSFLQVAMGWFLRDARLGILQTPRHFYSPDPFERNLRQFRTIPNEDELFYGVIQDGNDFWNATWFCGSCAVLRRSALDEAGGMAVETVTEDAHTSLRIQRLGWNSAYVNIPQAAGLATERLSEHVRQRVRWARGMVQILRLENPLFARGLSMAQRLCYFNAMSRFLYALPRLIFLTVPLMYLIFGYSTIAGGWAAILAYAAPHLVMSSVARSRIQGAHRHSFWTEIYETVLAPHLILPTLGAIVRPRASKSSTTSKGTVVGERFFDGRVAMPTLFLLSLNWFGLCCTLPRLIQFPVWHVARWASFANWPATLYDPSHAGTALINGGWAIFNLVLLGVASAAAWETRQRRKAVRVETQLASEVILQDGSAARGITSDLSSGGLRTTLEYALEVQPGDEVHFVLPVLDSTAVLPATVVAMDGRVLRARFDKLNLEQVEALSLLLYARADRWLGWEDTREPDRPVHSLVHVLRLAVYGLVQTMFGKTGGDDHPRRGGVASVVPMLTLLLLGSMGERTAAGLPNQVPPPGDFHQAIALRDSGATGSLRVPVGGPVRMIGFAVAQNELIKSATLHLLYRIPAGSGYHLAVSLNGASVGNFGDSSATPNAPVPQQENASRLLREDITIPAELLVRSNQLGFQLTADGDAGCSTRKPPAAFVDFGSSMEVAGTLIPLQDELGLLPVPFYQPGLESRPVVTVAFLGQPSAAAEQAAAIVASWLGVVADRTPLRFAVTMGAIPKGNAIVLAESSAALPAGLNLAAVSGPTVAMRTNPDDSYGKLLILTGTRGADLVQAARTLVTKTSLQGPDFALSGSVQVPARTPDDAPRWISTADSAELRFGSVAEEGRFTADDSGPAAVTLQLPPSLFFGDAADGQMRRTLPLHLGYEYNGETIGAGSTLEVEANGQRIANVPLPPTADAHTAVRDMVVNLPVSALRPFSNRLVFRFALRAKAGLSCAGAATGLTGSISKDSWLDVRGVPHWTELPDAGLFMAAGYPFTRRADLSGTSVVLPERASPEELTLLLTLMGHIGAQTGYPAVNVNVIPPSRIAPNRRMDYLVLGTLQDTAIMSRFGTGIPVTVSSGSLEAQRPSGLSGIKLPWQPVEDGGISAALIQNDSLPDVLLEAAEWPRRSQHGVVMLLPRDDDAIPGWIAQLLSPAPAVSGSVVLVRGGVFAAYGAGHESYTLGKTTWLMMVVTLLSRLPWVIATLSLLFCFLIASVLRTTLRRGARIRLQGTC